MATALLVLTFVFAITDWIGIERGWVRARYLSKPAPLLALMAWFSLLNGWQAGGLWFGLALVFSMLGDILLLLPDRYLVPGIMAFLVAQVLYIVGFNQVQINPDPLALVVFVVVAVAALRIFSIIRPGLIRTGNERMLLAPVVVYTSAISLMLFSAWLCLFRPGWPLAAALLVGAGALSFFVSDSATAYFRFIRRIPHSDLLVMTTYHLGQIAIIAGVVLSVNGAV